MTHDIQEYISVKGAKEHNLKNVDIDIPRNKLVVITGLSGSGKSSLAFDTIYAEGQRRYVESLSSYARQFLHLQKKPNVESISGLSPAIAIDQKTTSRNPRSTVGTITEIYDYLRLLFARIGVPYSPVTNLPITSQTISEMVDIISKMPKGTKVYILAPIVRGQKGEFRYEILNLKKQGFRRLIVDNVLYDIDDLPKIEKTKQHNIEVVVDRIEIASTLGNRIAESLEVALDLADGVSYLQVVELPNDYVELPDTDHRSDASSLHAGQQIIFSQKYACPVSDFQLVELEPRIFSFNSPFGACAKCEGLGKELQFDPELIVQDPTLSIAKGAIDPFKNMNSKFFTDTMESLSNHYNFDLNTPFNVLTQDIQTVLMYGSKNEVIKFTYRMESKNNVINQPFAGIIPSLEEKFRKLDTESAKDEMNKYRSENVCSECNGTRLKSESLCVKIDNLNISQITSMTIIQAQAWFSALSEKLTQKQILISQSILKEISSRIHFLINVGLDYLSLARESCTLSGGESQRIRLASQIGSGLTGVLYVLDEPSIGLHQRDNARLLSTLVNLKELGNTVLVVEHDDETMQSADYIVDVGVGAGVHGGKIIAHGSLSDIINCKESITGQYLSGNKSILIPQNRKIGNANKIIELIGATANNLQNVDIKLYLGTFTAVTGVSGGGKSSLIMHTLYKAILKHIEPTSKVHPAPYSELKGYEHIDKIIDINQSPIGRTPRSNPATYTGVFAPIRDWFAELPEAKMRGYKSSRFSFNVKGGRCESCQGDGLIKIEMHFLPDIYVNCDVCNGARYNRETLEIKYKNKSISDVLNMTVEDAMVFFDKINDIYTKLNTLNEVGLGYIKLGQSATTLSGGEAQRVKLAKELAKRSTGKTLYILDEPTTGLHIDDINKLLKVLHKLVDLGNTVLVIEHNMDVIKTADYIIDVGPEGGDKGGRIVAQGSPEQILKSEESFTGQYLKKYLTRTMDKE